MAKKHYSLTFPRATLWLFGDGWGTPLPQITRKRILKRKRVGFRVLFPVCRFWECYGRLPGVTKGFGVVLSLIQGHRQTPPAPSANEGPSSEPTDQLQPTPVANDLGVGQRPSRERAKRDHAQEDWHVIQNAQEAEHEGDESVTRSFAGMCTFSSEVIGQQIEGGSNEPRIERAKGHHVDA